MHHMDLIYYTTTSTTYENKYDKITEFKVLRKTLKPESYKYVSYYSNKLLFLSKKYTVST